VVRDAAASPCSAAAACALLSKNFQKKFAKGGELERAKAGLGSDCFHMTTGGNLYKRKRNAKEKGKKAMRSGDGQG